ncbi:YggT family protein [Umezawaea endophytica]|jgi:YggT family protein|uniref:YggT family protein n=1 Tax=Umezawaea endophytica TaxID=1654476 RepID=A0A9X2VIB2_9PSEU|nr:YggT family protein [Umezawaea endophytica]MCS7477230.1 YggT family protein [Umezawaea endophytica]
MSFIGSLLGTVLLLFWLVMLVRLVFDWVGVVSTSPAPAWTSRVRSVSWSITEPVIAPVRRVLRPVRVGGVSIDLAFTAVLVGVLVLRTIVTAVF